MNNQYYYMGRYTTSAFFNKPKYGTVSSKITLVILFKNFQDKQKKSNACIEIYGYKFSVL